MSKLHNRTEQSHRPIKQRYYPMRGFGSFKTAAAFCLVFDELRNFFKARLGRLPTLKEKRRIRASKIFSLKKMAESF